MLDHRTEAVPALMTPERALDPSLTEHEVAELSHAASDQVRAAVAERHDVSVITMLKLARDSSPEVRASVARNSRPDMPEEILVELADDKSREVVYALIYNPAVPTSVLAHLARPFRQGPAGAARARLAQRTAPSSVTSRRRSSRRH
ncbi:hypothetical protein [uncultured Demequina sp.]|uniref:hypothetical protein n=1 Tax=uncultured Demequina sp. TaxID=693499 RepID=UPI0025CC287D|nr:hypothetical protein [uncultured Demequina sp.]